ncbi:hypothetical protein phiK7A1_031c [Pseudomonas phage phiK7A1]|uniref:Uncharacterized protein n=1 Tax=Pseudomonas phage phiK7A1 TaxID=2759194 RepID=A0A7H0XFN1_9CAUD|nr:hypothetical protein phiK7A1_031c [Pseudomonas phage phiK7A1]
MIGEIVVMGLLVLVIVIAVYMVTRKPAPEFVVPEPWKAPVKREETLREFVNRVPERPVYKAGKASQQKASSSGSRSHSPSGGSTTHIDTQSSDLMSTMLILDAMDTQEKYSSPSVDTYSSQSYSSPTPSSYSDSCSSRSSYSSYSDSSSSSSSSSDSSSSSSSSSSCD